MSQDLFDDKNVVKANWAKFEKVGDSYTGVYVKKEQKVNTLKGDGSMQTIYTLVQEDGSELKVGGPGGRDLGQFNNLKFGAFVGVKYVADIPAKKAGYRPSKQVTVFSGGEMRPEVYEAWKQENGVFAGANEVEAPEEPGF